MRETTSLIRINGVAIPTPDDGFSIGEYTNVDAGRNANGVVVGQKIGRNIWKIEGLKWSRLTQQEWVAIKNALKPFYVKVEFTADDGKRHKVTMYPGDRKSTPTNVVGLSYMQFRDCEFNLIDCGIVSED